VADIAGISRNTNRRLIHGAKNQIKEGVWSAFRMHPNYTGSTVGGNVHCSADKPGEIKSNNKLMARSEELGRELVTN